MYYLSEAGTQEISGINGCMYQVMKTFVCRGCVNPVTGTVCTSVDIGVIANSELVDKFFRGHVECRRRC